MNSKERAEMNEYLKTKFRTRTIEHMNECMARLDVLISEILEAGNKFLENGDQGSAWKAWLIFREIENEIKPELQKTLKDYESGEKLPIARLARFSDVVDHIKGKLEELKREAQEAKE